MAAFTLTDFLNDVKLEVAAAVPEVLPTTGGGVIDAEHQSTVAWASLKLPIAVVIANRFQPGRMGVANLSYEFAVEIYLVRQAVGKADTLRGKLEDLINHFWPDDPLAARGHGQRIRMGEWRYDDDLYPNTVLRGANRAQRAGLVELICVAGKRRG